MSTNKPVIRSIFWIAGLVGMSVVIVSAMRNQNAQAALQSQLDRIENAKPTINVLPASPTIQVVPANGAFPTSKQEISFVQNPLSPQAIQYPWQKAKNYDKPGMSAILTASGEIKHPLFIFKCNVPCIFTDGSGISTSFLIHLVKEKSTDVRLVLQLDVPGKLTDGEQIEMDFRSQNDKQLRIESVQLAQQ